MKDLTHLADLIRIRNYVNASVGRIIHGPAETGRIAEFIASEIFDIELAPIFVEKSLDGWFRSPSELKGKSVNVKYRSSSSRRLNIINSVNPSDHPDYYLALRGPFTPRGPSEDKLLPLVIQSVYLFHAADLIAAMQAEGYTKFGPSVKKVYWDRARIFPDAYDSPLILTDEQRAALELFAPA